MRRLIVMTVLMLLFATSLAFAKSADIHKRGFMFGLGPGFSAAVRLTIDGVDYSNKISDFGTIGVWYNLRAGYAITPKLYLDLETIYGQPFALQSNKTTLFLFAPGVRFYPKTTGLVLGARAGITTSRTISQNNVTTWAPHPGFGFGLLAGYDFRQTPTGFGWELDSSLDNTSISGESVWDLELSVSALWK